MIAWEALTLSDEVVNWAWLPLKVTGEPASTPSTWNWTVPVRVVVAGAFADTVAVKVTLSPKTVGLFAVLTAVVVVPWLMVTVSAGTAQAPALPCAVVGLTGFVC